MHTREPERIYARQLPGGGFVVIDVTPARTFLGRQCFRGEVVVERRTEEHRRYGHSPPVLAQAEAGTIGGVLHKLLPTARSNTAIAVSCLARQGERAPAW